MLKAIYEATFSFQKMIKKKQLSQKNYCPVGTRFYEKFGNFLSCSTFQTKWN